MTVRQIFLNHLRIKKIPTIIFLSNGVKLNGVIESFDESGIILTRSTVAGTNSQLVLFHAMSTILPENAADAHWSDILKGKVEVDV